MKIGIYTDVHFSEYSSILRGESTRYSIRLEGLVKSINWAEQESINQKCDRIMILGDFFNAPDLNSREITALQEIKWNSLPHYCLVGNHDASSKSLKYNSVMALKNKDFTIIDKPTVEKINNYYLLMLPYITDDERKPLSEYVSDDKDINNQNLIILSHNDVKGIRYGRIESKAGFDINEIETTCRIFLNGHLHNGTKFCKNGINLGNFTGQNFTEDAINYSHNLFILDTDKLSLDTIENPFAFNFYSFEFINTLNLNILDDIKGNSILNIKCLDSIQDEVEKKLSTLSSRIIMKRITLEHSLKAIDQENLKELQGNNESYLDKFVKFSKEKLSDSPVLDYELGELCK